jgi:hypothetical protein
METTRRIGTTFLAVLTLLSLAVGVLCGGCDACPLATARSMAGSQPGGVSKSVVPPCCHHSRTAPAIRKASCCNQVRTAVPNETSRAAPQPPSPASAALASAAPADPPVQTVAESPGWVPIPEPPRVPDRLGLYTLHAAFLI